jgi:hypothetical protein
MVSVLQIFFLLSMFCFEYGRMAFQEHGLSDEVVNFVSQFIEGTTLEIQVIWLNIRPWLLCFG